MTVVTGPGAPASPAVAEADVVKAAATNTAVCHERHHFNAIVIPPSRLLGAPSSRPSATIHSPLSAPDPGLAESPWQALWATITKLAPEPRSADPPSRRA